MRKSFLKFVSLAFAFVLFIGSSQTIAFASYLTSAGGLHGEEYVRYFSEDHYYVDRTLTDFSKDYVFDIDESGNLFRMPFTDHLNKTNQNKVILFNQCKVNDYTLVDDELLFATDNKIYRADLNGENLSVVFALPALVDKSIESIFADYDLIWFKIEDSIYRLYRKTNDLDRIYTDSRILSYQPVSNHSISFEVYNSDAIAFFNNSGSDDDIYFNAVDRYVYNENGATTTQVDINSLNAGVTHYTSYSPVTINGTSVPTSTYPIGSFIGEYSYKACTHHTTTNVSNCRIDGSCGCQVLGNSQGLGTGIQCNGFAKQIYWDMFGSTLGTYHSSMDTSTVTKARNVLTELNPGAHIRSNGHSLILLCADEDGADFYHANYQAACKVSVSNFTYSAFKSRYATLKVYDGR